MSTATAHDDARAALRRALVDARPRWYSPWLHLAGSFGLSGGLSALAAAQVQAPAAGELATIPLTFLFCNALEWKVHKDLLHRRSRLLAVFYDRHTPVHHRAFVDGDMAIRSIDELGLVLIPWYASLGLLVMALPMITALAWAFGRDIAALFLATAMGYVLLYEAFHLAYHLPADSAIGRLRLIRALRRHHATHHRPALMRGWNFNVILPLWDWVMQTRWREPGG